MICNIHPNRKTDNKPIIIMLLNHMSVYYPPLNTSLNSPLAGLGGVGGGCLVFSPPVSPSTFFLTRFDMGKERLSDGILDTRLLSESKLVARLLPFVNREFIYNHTQ